MTKKIYLDNPYLKEIKANVYSKKHIDNNYHIILDRTIFYPHLSGGQPKDTGTINGVKVKDVYEEGDNIVHVLSKDIGDKKVNLSIDWNTRFDHMQQHTGQHILSSAFNKLYGASTVGFHLGSSFVYIDIELPTLNNNEIKKVERFANEIIFSNFDIKTYIINKFDIDKFPLRKPPSVDNNIRIVEINDIDFSPCSGTHHRGTGEVGLIKIRRWEKYKGNVRVEFVCGNRALNDYYWKNNQINAISNLLSIKDNKSLDAVNRIYNENKQLLKQIKNYKEKIQNHKVDNFLTNAPIHNNIKIVYHIFDNKNFNDIRIILSKILNQDCSIVVFGNKQHDKCQIIMGRSDNIDLDMTEIFNSIADIIDGNGGGNEKIIQGGGSKPENISQCIKKALSLIGEKIK
ncbi:alanyl-tRNA editing protein [Dethiothermospora halolimnae]|uniref:alanyl-tRNA editing protein n=1 Tax=Dethiothermospora halolimnae TaxID=3114390 RepID=UPI003CCBCD28